MREKPKTEPRMPPLASGQTYTPRPDRSGVERKSDEALGRESDLEQERKVREAREEELKVPR